MKPVLKPVQPRQGLAWVRQGLALFMRRPLGFTLIFMMFLLSTLLLMAVPLVGGVLGLALLPLMTLAFLVAARGLLSAQPEEPQAWRALLQAGRAEQAALLKLCALYGVLAFGVLWLFQALAGDPLLALEQAMRAPQPDAEQIAQALSEPGLSQGLLVLGLLGSVLSVPFWHAPPLVWWGGQGLAQALFSSTVSLWRAKGAFALYTLGWLGAYLGATLVLALGLSLLGLQRLAPVASLPLSLAFSAAFYASLWFTFDDCIAIGPRE